MKKLIIAIINSRSTKKLKDELLGAGFRITELESKGGFLGKKSTTFVIGAETKHVEKILSIIEKNCKRKEEFIAGAGQSVGEVLGDVALDEGTAKLQTGGATVFVLNIDTFKKI